MFPRLDVDYHLAPFVDPRDHEGLAQARVRIGAPHFAKPREFWVRPVRSYVDRVVAIHLIMHPVKAETSRLFIYLFFAAADKTDAVRSWKSLEVLFSEVCEAADFDEHICRVWRPTKHCAILCRSSRSPQLSYFAALDTVFDLSLYEKLPAIRQMSLNTFIELKTAIFTPLFKKTGKMRRAKLA